MHESPFLGWIIPYSWQEPGQIDDPDDGQTEITDEIDEDGYLITTT